MEEIQKLQGEWHIVTLEVEGNTLPEPFFAGAKIIVDGDSFTSYMGDATYGGTFRVDANADPRTIDLLYSSGPHAGKSSPGIFELNDGGEWKLCLAFAGRGRPAGFHTTTGSGHALETLKRSV
jgi:uncharacterized protein (TIGR03067 family)